MADIGLGLGLALALWWLFDIRRVLRLRIVPRRDRVRGPSEATIQPAETFRGAVPPHRFVVVRWPSGTMHYQGTLPGLARQSYEHEHPLPGEAVELWELGTCRGHKEA